MRRTLEGTKVKRQRVSGFRARMATPGGREVLNRRRARGRHKLAITAKTCLTALFKKGGKCYQKRID